VRKHSWLILAGLLAAGAVSAAENTEGWRKVYSYDELNSSLVINDFRFLTAQHGVAAGFLLEKDGKIKPTTLVTNDGGQHWTLTPVKDNKDIPVSLFFRDSSRGWMVTDDAIWTSEDGGRTWKKLTMLSDIERVYFASAEHGWAVGGQKKVYETFDGGKTWKELAAAVQPDSTPERTVYNWIDFAGPDAGIITGWNQPAVEARRVIPEWVSPTHSSSARREAPHISIFLQTRNGGKTWNPTTGSLFGHVACVRLSLNGYGLGIIQFKDAFDWPSEVFRIDWTTGESSRVFREQNRLITDVALPPSGPAYLTGIEKLDHLNDSPVPGKVKVLRSEDLDNWQEMDVDYRATAHRVMISAIDDKNIWIATDTGMVLKLVPAK
jgi:Photosynthesis system II assembly factor YCF48